MRAAIFASSYYPHLGGVEEAVRQLAAQQRADGDEPMIVTMRWPKTLPAVEIYESTPVRRHVFRIPERKPRFLLGTALTSGLIARTIASEIKAHGSRVVHVQ